MLAGTVVLGLLLFRLIWGLIGSSTARFSSFVRGPRAIMSYLNGRAVHVLGHNPLGGWSVIAMLAALAVQVGLGLFASDEDGLDSGPLAYLVSYERSAEIADLHETGFEILLVLIGIHIAAILYYAAVKRDDLVRPMLTGSRNVPTGVEPMQKASPLRFAIAAFLAASIALWIANGF